MQVGDLIERAPLAFLVAAIIAFTAVGLVRRSRVFLLSGVVVAVTLLGMVVPFPRDIPPQWRSVIRNGLIVAMVAFLWVALVQEPAWLARRLGFVRRSPDWEYDVILSGLMNDFQTKERAARDLDIAARERDEPPPATERDALRAEAEQILARLRATPTPSEGWATLAAECAELLELGLEHFGVPISEEVRREFVERDAKVSARRDRLVADYRAKARSAFRWP